MHIQCRAHTLNIANAKKPKTNVMYLKNELYKLIQSDESIFDFIQNSLFDGFWYWDLEKPENQWINDRFWTMLGYNPDEMPPRPAAWQSLINQDDFKLAYANLTRHCENPNHPFDQIVRYIHKNGSTVWFRCRGMAIRDANGKPVRMLGANQDVTVLKRREEELFTAKQKAEESEEKLKSILENLQDTFFQADLTGNFTFANSRASGMYGYAVKEIIGTPAANLYADADERKTLIKNLKKEGKIYDWTCRGLKKDGTSFWVSMNVQFTKDNQGNIIGTEGIVRDITEKKKAEQELKEAKEKAEESEEKFRLLHENAGLGIGYYTSDGIILSYNQIAAKHMNGKPEDFIGKSIFELFPKESADFYFNRIQNAINSSQPMVYEDFVQLPTEDKWFISTFTKIENARQQVLGIQIISQDVTKLKTTEIELQKAKEKAEESEKKFRKSIEFSPVPMAVAKNNGDLLFLNKQFVETFGYSIEELGSIQKWFELAYPDVEYRNSRFTQWSSDLEFALKNGVPAPVREGFVTCKNGVVKTIEISISVDNDISIGLFLDITERKNKEEKIREKDVQFRKLSANVPDLIYQFIRKPDGTYCVPISSEGIKNIFGCSPEDVVDDFAPIARVIFPEDAERVIRDIEYSAEHLTYFTCEFRVQIPGKPVQWILSRSTPEKLPDGSVTWYGFNADITDRKQNEHAIMAKMDELERFHKITIGRETTMVELKKEVNRLLNKLGEDNKYNIVE